MVDDFASSIIPSGHGAGSKHCNMLVHDCILHGEQAVAASIGDSELLTNEPLNTAHSWNSCFSSSKSTIEDLLTRLYIYKYIIYI